MGKWSEASPVAEETSILEMDLPFRELSPPGEKENQLQMCLGKGYVSS